MLRNVLFVNLEYDAFAANRTHKNKKQNYSTFFRLFLSLPKYENLVMFLGTNDSNQFSS